MVDRYILYTYLHKPYITTTHSSPSSNFARINGCLPSDWVKPGQQGRVLIERQAFGGTLLVLTWTEVRILTRRFKEKDNWARGATSHCQLGIRRGGSAGRGKGVCLRYAEAFCQSCGQCGNLELPQSSAYTTPRNAVSVV